MQIKGTRIAVAVIFPDKLVDFVPKQGNISVAHKYLQQHKFFWCQFDWYTVPQHRAIIRIDDKIALHKLCRILMEPPQHNLYTRDQLHDLKRFHDIILSTEI